MVERCTKLKTKVEGEKKMKEQKGITLIALVMH